MSLTRILAIVLRQMYLMKGSATRIISIFIWVGIDMVLWGFLTRYLGTLATPGFNFVTVMLGGVLMWNFSQRAMFGVTMAFFEDVWSRNFLNFFATPLSIGEYLAGLVLTSIVTSTIALVVMLLLAIGIFGLSLFAYGIALLPFVLILFMFGIAIGIVGCALVLRLGPAAEWFVWPIPALLAPFVCVFYPRAVLPQWMQWVSQALPPSHVFENIRAIVSGGQADLHELLLSCGLAAGYILLACLLFTRVYRHAVRSGLIARYSAETVS